MEYPGQAIRLQDWVRSSSFIVAAANCKLLRRSIMGSRDIPICCTSNASFRKGHWTNEEDELLKVHLKCHGDRGNWSQVPKAAGLHRSGKSCRLRWVNYLKPDLKRGAFSRDEEDLIVKLHSLLGNRWSLIAGRIPGRTDNEIKNYWNSHLSKKILSRGCSDVKHMKSCAGAQGISLTSLSSNSNEVTWLEHGDILVVKSISSSSSQQQLDCCNVESYNHNSALSPCSSQPTSALSSIQDDTLVLLTMQQLQADISIEQEQVEGPHGGLWDWDFSEDLTLEANGLLEVLEWL